MRRSVFTRLLVVVVLIAVCSIAATAWLATQLTKASIAREQGRELASDNRIYAALLLHATTHRDWSEVDGLIRSLAGELPHRRIVLVTKDGRTVVDQGGDGGELPATASAVVDALAVDPVLVPDAPADRIDKRVLGPFRTPIDFREREDRTGSLFCLRMAKKEQTRKDCRENQLPFDTAADFYALLDLEDLVNACLARRSLPPVELDPDYTPATKQTSGAPPPDEPAVAACVAASRKEQLAQYVAPPVLLYLTSPSGTPTTAISLSGNGWQVVGAAAAVLLAAVGVAAFAGARITRPLRALTAAAQHMSGGSDIPPVPVRGQDEIAGLTRAFNTMAANRAQLEQARKAMVSDVAHELRTPLSNIRGWLEAAEDGVSDLDPALVTLLLKEALVLQHVVDDLQDLAIADAGSLRLTVEQVSVPAVVEQVRAAHEARAAQAGIALAVAAEELVVDADAVRLRQVLDNLVANALRYVPSGGSVTVSAAADGPDAVISVADTGSGIAAQDLPHVFDRFWRADKSRARSTGGSGLGLAIVRKLVEAHGGAVGVTSTPGRGTTFTVRLPVTAAAAGAGRV
ncbi:HAMP domain-containing sensor histidine kinase [Lentzea flava]|uniref:histidine kinase n=1 Tax=Lentzea flava TaxID=103732 RepID=A0ABQ2U902_9PSEU|nr:HAMP domain-containing sensor histidine kinase [Lentzea flava]MCP2197092.1 two-component system, OmpR family, sensor histidine kinase BaeS [Lentzea flava]GGU13401.1 two-component sensor histidine kinase [Lentzea flava]